MTQLTDHLHKAPCVRARNTRTQGPSRCSAVSCVSGPTDHHMTQDALFAQEPTATRTTGQHKDPMPAWLLAELERRLGGFRTARWQRCPTCHAITLHGMDDDIAAGMATADPTPLTPQGEYACTLIHRPTYEAVPRGRTYELWLRDSWRMDKPPDPPKVLVLPAHRCGARFPGFTPTTHTRTGNGPDDEPPF